MSLLYCTHIRITSILLIESVVDHLTRLIIETFHIIYLYTSMEYEIRVNVVHISVRVSAIRVALCSPSCELRHVAEVA